MSLSQRPRVLFVTPWYPHPELPYGGIFVREHARAVQPYCDVAVLHVLGSMAQLAERYLLEKDNFNDDVEKESRQQISTYVLRYRKGPSGTDRLWRHWATQRALRQVIKQEFVPDLIHAHIHRMALPSYIFGSLNKIPVVITEHHSAFPLKSLNRLDIAEAKISFRHAKRVMPVSRSLQKSIEEHGIHANFQVVPNVVDTELFKREPSGDDVPDDELHGGKVKLLCVGGMPETHVKGYPYLFDALAGLEKKQRWQLDIIGDGPMMSEYVARVKELNLDDRITFHGYKMKPQIAAAMNNADVFVLPSLWETMGCVLIEAMSTGLPIVATRTGGIPEVVTSECGLLAEPGDAQSLSVALIKMMDTYHQFSPDQIREKAQQKYSYDAVGMMLDEIYRDASRSN